MWTGKFLRYLLVSLCAFSSNAVWGQNDQKTVNVYFNEKQTNGVPTISFGSNAPAGVTVTQSGFTWASKYKFSALIHLECTDRVVVKKSNTTPSSATISFSGFKYKIKQVKWNVICDLLAETPKVNTSITSKDGETITGKFENNKVSFSVKNYPGTTDNLNFIGLNSLVIKDEIRDEYSRVFLKAGKGNDFAFQITYYEPSVSLDDVPNQIKLGQTLDISKQHTIKNPGNNCREPPQRRLL